MAMCGRFVQRQRASVILAADTEKTKDADGHVTEDIGRLYNFSGPAASPSVKPKTDANFPGNFPVDAIKRPAQSAGLFR